MVALNATEQNALAQKLILTTRISERVSGGILYEDLDLHKHHKLLPSRNATGSCFHTQTWQEY